VIVGRPGLVLAVLVLSACTTVGPDYQEPDVAWLEDWQPDLYGQVAPAELQGEQDLRFWWRLFDDPVLSDLVETARRESPSAQLAGLRILESRAAAGIAGSARYPQVQQLGGSAASVTSAETGSGTSGAGSGAASNPPTLRFSPPSPISRTYRYC
jgi:outer membrane protein TolC